jgi:TRAP transporter TAXI family solute receptor
VYYIYGEELARILTEKIGITVNPLPTQGSVQNVKLLESGGAQVALITMSTGREGWNGIGAWTKGQQFRNIRALFPMYDNPFQAVVLQRSGLATLPELDKKRVGVGPRSGNGATYAPEIFKVVGISAQLSYGSYNDIATELLDGRVDALLTLLGAPVPAIQDVDAKEPVKFLALSPEQMQAIRNAIPDFSPSKIAAGTYRLLDKDYVTIAVPNFVIGRPDLPDELAYRLVKAAFENQPRLVKATLAARDTVPQNVEKNNFLPFHPGAVRYYREIGIGIPEALSSTH